MVESLACWHFINTFHSHQIQILRHHGAANRFDMPTWNIIWRKAVSDWHILCTTSLPCLIRCHAFWFRGCGEKVFCITSFSFWFFLKLHIYNFNKKILRILQAMNHNYQFFCCGLITGPLIRSAESVSRLVSVNAISVTTLLGKSQNSTQSSTSDVLGSASASTRKYSVHSKLWIIITNSSAVASYDVILIPLYRIVWPGWVVFQ